MNLKAAGRTWDSQTDRTGGIFLDKKKRRRNRLLFVVLDCLSKQTFQGILILPIDFLNHVPSLGLIVCIFLGTRHLTRFFESKYSNTQNMRVYSLQGFKGENVITPPFLESLKNSKRASCSSFSQQLHCRNHEKTCENKSTESLK